MVPMSGTTNFLILSDSSYIPKLDLAFLGIVSAFCCNVLISSYVIAFLLCLFLLSFLGVSIISANIILLLS